MFVRRPSEQVKEAAADHLDGPVQLAIPVSWGIGLSTSGILTATGGVVIVGTVLVTFGLTWVWGAGLFVYFSWFLAQVNRGGLGRGVLALTDPSTEGRRIVVLRAGGWSPTGPSRGLHRSYPATTELAVADGGRWWQSLQCRVGDDLYFINHNYVTEVSAALPRYSSSDRSQD